MSDVAQQTSGSDDIAGLSDAYSAAVGDVLEEDQGSLSLPLEPISTSASETPDSAPPSLVLPVLPPETTDEAAAPYMDAVQDVLHEDDFNRRVTIYQALQSTPARSAEAGRIGRALGSIPAPIVEEDFEAYRQLATWRLWRMGMSSVTREGRRLRRIGGVACGALGRCLSRTGPPSVGARHLWILGAPADTGGACGHWGHGSGAQGGEAGWKIDYCL